MSQEISQVPLSGQQPSAIPPRDLLIGHIRAHVRKGDAAKERAAQNHKKSEDHYIAAGRYLTELKNHYSQSWAHWESILTIDVKISTGRASELMQLADGRKDLQQIRDEKAKSVAQHRARNLFTTSPCSEEEDSPEDPLRPTSSAPSTPQLTISPGKKMLRLRAAALIIDLTDEDIRNMALKMVLEGERQTSFDDFRNAVVDLYQALSRAGR